MQWKGPYDISEVVGLNDYKVKVKGKIKVHDNNPLKKCHEQEVEAVDVEPETDPDCREDLVEIGGYTVK